VFYAIIYLFLEVMISSVISGEIGGLMTFIEIIISFMIGIFLLKNFKFSLMDKINDVKNGDLTQDEFIKSSVGAAIGAILLMIPGFFTDIFGLLLQFSLFTVLFSKIFKFKPKAMPSNNKQYLKKGDDDVIDVEVIEIIDDDKHIKH